MREDRSGKPITVLLVDGDAILRRALRHLLEPAGMHVAEVDSAVQAGERMAEVEPAVVVLGAPERGRRMGEEIQGIREGLPQVQLVVLAPGGAEADAAAAIAAGADGYLLKDDPPEEIVAAIRLAAAGTSPVSSRIVAELLGKLRPRNGNGSPELTTRERDVLELVARGQSNAEIAAALSISVPTVKRHISHLLLKLRAGNRTQAAVEAVRQGLL